MRTFVLLFLAFSLSLPFSSFPSIIVRDDDQYGPPFGVAGEDGTIRLDSFGHRPNACAVSSSFDELSISISPEERRSSSLNERNLRAAVSGLRTCGVIVLEDVFTPEEIHQFRDAMSSVLEPLLDSRGRLVEAVHLAKMERKSLEKIWKRDDALRNEVLLSQGHVYRERNAGRIDLTLPWSEPFNLAQFTSNPIISEVLTPMLGNEYRLKGMQAVIALNASNGNDYQHWHRDDGLLFGGHTNGPLPAHAFNAFYLLRPFTQENGPTEFMLGSHTWGSDWNERVDSHVTHASFYPPMGSVVLFDYRIVHRGTKNVSPEARPVAMYIYGRSWWNDVVNYGVNYGGSSRKRVTRMEDMVSEVRPQTTEASQAEKKRMFRHLARLWNR